MSAGMEHVGIVYEAPPVGGVRLAGWIICAQVRVFFAGMRGFSAS